MRALVLGSTGLLGSMFEKVAAAQPAMSLFTASRQASPKSTHFSIDLGTESPAELLRWARPEVIFHFAAMTNVDECERQQERAYEVNAGSVKRLLEEMEKICPSAKLIYISSDAVKAEGQPYAQEDCRVGPLNYYGMTKQMAEELITRSELDCTSIRTTIVGSKLHLGQSSFSDWIVSSLKGKKQINLFDDAVFTPISTADLSRHLISLAALKLPKLLHLCGGDGISKYDFGLKLAHALGLDPAFINRTSLSDSGLLASRLRDQTLASRWVERELKTSMPSITETINQIASEFKELIKD